MDGRDRLAIRNRSLALAELPWSLIVTNLCTRPSSAQVHGALQLAYKLTIDEMHRQGTDHPCCATPELIDLPGYKYACSSSLIPPIFFVINLPSSQRISACPPLNASEPALPSPPLPLPLPISCFEGVRMSG